MIVCVLRSGGIYGVEHVARLKSQLDQHAPGVEVMCLTDVPAVLSLGVRVRGLMRRWAGWFSKIEALAVPGPVLMMDLDVSVVSDLTPLLQAAQTTDFAMCRGFWGPADPNPLNSSVMMWQADAPRHLVELFGADVDRFVQEGKRRDRWGDQGFIARHFGGPIDTVQDLVPGAVLSFKREVLRFADTSRMAICVSHGMPRPWDKNGADAWLKQHAYALA